MTVAVEQDVTTPTLTFCTNEEFLHGLLRGHGGRVVTLSPPTSEAGVRSPHGLKWGKLVVACHWSAVYSTQP